MSSRKLAAANEFRVIGGQYRRRKLSFAAESDARPTPNRVRETLFNWLEPYIAGLRAADLFAGSGALGIEALSRAAGSVVFVERDPRLASGLSDNLQRLGSTNATVLCTTAEAWIASDHEPVDLVFLDPPFAARNHGKLCKLLELHRSIVPGGWCYLEMSAEHEPDALPEHWEVVRDKRAGNVRYQLVKAGAA